MGVTAEHAASDRAVYYTKIYHMEIDSVFCWVNYLRNWEWEDWPEGRGRGMAGVQRRADFDFVLL